MVQFTQDYASDVKQLESIRHLISRACREAWGLAENGEFEENEPALHELLLAVQEAASNVIRHGCQGERDRIIKVEIDVDDERALVVLHYQGEGFDPDAVAPPSFDGSRYGGFGLYLIEKLVDEVEYQHHRGRCSTRLVKYRRTPPSRG